MFIYLIVNHDTGKYYVGQHKGNNLRQYLQRKFWDAKHQRSGSSHLYNSMRKHPDSKVWSIHALRADIQTREELDETERDFIKFLKAQDPEYGYNICRGGEGFTGTFSKETLEKLSKARRQTWANPGYRVKKSEEMRKRWSNPQARAKQSEVMKEACSNPDVRAKKSETIKGLDSKTHAIVFKNLEKRWVDSSASIKQSEAMKEVWKDSEYKKTVGVRISEGKKANPRKNYICSPETRIKLSIASKRVLSDPKVKAKKSEAGKKLWDNPEYVSKILEARKKARLKK